MPLSFGSQAGEYFTRSDHYYVLPTVQILGKKMNTAMSLTQRKLIIN